LRYVVAGYILAWILLWAYDLYGWEIWLGDEKMSQGELDFMMDPDEKFDEQMKRLGFEPMKAKIKTKVFRIDWDEYLLKLFTRRTYELRKCVGTDQIDWPECVRETPSVHQEDGDTGR
jgi:hypothetical protein